MLKAGPPPAELRPGRLNPGRRGLGLALLFASLLCTSSTGAAATRATVNAPEGLNLRDSPNAAARVIALLPYGTAVDVVGAQSDDGWVEINTSGRLGYVKSVYLDLPATSLRGDAVVVPADGLRLRTAPSPSAPTLATLPAGRVVHIQADPTPDGWYLVQTVEGLGYVDGTFLQPAATGQAPILIRWYGHDFDGGIMACGGIYSADDPMISASTSFPCGTPLKICASGHCVNVVVRDHGLMGPGAIDLSAAAFQRLAPLDTGALNGTVQVLTEAASRAATPVNGPGASVR